MSRSHNDMLQLRLLLSCVLLFSVIFSACQGKPSPSNTISTSTSTGPGAEAVTQSFLQAWEQGYYAAMYRLLTPTTKTAISEDQFVTAYSSAAETMTLDRLTTSLRSVLEEEGSAQAEFSATFETLMVGSFQVTNVLPLEWENDGWGIVWSKTCIIPHLSSGNQLYLRPVVPLRGNIYDRSGWGLAVNGTQAVVGIVPGQLQDEGRTLLLLSQVMEEPIASLRDKYASAPLHWFVPLGEISAQESTQHYDTLTSLPGVVIREKPVRLYRDGKLAPHTVGYVGVIGAEEAENWRKLGYPPDAVVGKAALEAWGEPYLSGSPGGTLTMVSPEGVPVATLSQRSSRQSQSIYTTLDRALQERAVELLEGKRGAIVALDPQTGQVLAIVSSPTFDSNVFTPPITQADWHKLINTPGQPLINRATQGLYPPGSTFKIVTMAAAMEAGFFAPSSSFECKGTWMGLGEQWPMRCWISPRQHGVLDLLKGLVVSCDSVFYEVGLRLDQQDSNILRSYARHFGLGEPTGLLGLPSWEDSPGYEEAGLVPDDAWMRKTMGTGWTPGDSVNLAIGQGYLLVTPLQMAVLVSAVANGGTFYKPQIVRRISGAEGNPERFFNPEVRGALPVAPEHLSTIREGLRRVVIDEKGTTRNAFQGSSLSAAGKTGTSENPGGDPHAWFVGYAPFDDPQIAMAVVVENGGEGSVVAAPIFRILAESYLGVAAAMAES